MDALGSPTRSHHFSCLFSRSSPSGCRRFDVLVLVLVLFLLSSSVFISSSSIIYRTINEELEIGSVVADLKRDARLNDEFSQSVLSSLRFTILSSSPQDAHSNQFFELNQSTGLVRTVVRLDRDRICPGATKCLLPVDAAIQPPHFRMIKLSIELLDENDNAPKFPNPILRTSLSESTAPGPFFPIQLAEDPDSPSNGVVRYVIQPHSEHFGIKVTKSDLDGSIEDVQLVLKEVLDREEKDSYQVKVIAFDGGNPPKSGSVTIEISVTDVNDHRPEFERTTYDVEVTENTPPKRSFVTVRATDRDSGPNGVVSYKFSSKSHSLYGHLFSIDSASGQISLLKSLDYEQHSLIALEVLAQDHGPGSSPVMARVVVTVRDTNDNAPAIKLDLSGYPEEVEEDGKQVIHVAENIASNTHILQMTVEDQDSGEGGRVTCQLLSNDNSKIEHFQLVELYEKEFGLVSKGIIDRELNDRYELMVNCKDNGRPQLTSGQNLVIIIDDINDNAPRFDKHEYDISIKENIGSFEVILQVTATDADAGENAAITYSLVEDSEAEDKDEMMFHIDKYSGAIWTTKSLDRERKDIYKMQVIAFDSKAKEGGGGGGKEIHSSSASLTIHLIDVNDQIPRFHQTRYNFSVYENQPSKTLVGQVTAYDLDLSPMNNKFTYHLDTNASPTSHFRIDQNSGEIWTRTSLNREERNLHEIRVLVKDEGLPLELPDGALVSIYVMDENDNAPFVLFPSTGNDTVFVANTLPVGHVVASIVANDPDVGDNARLTYIISDGNDEDLFRIEQRTGDVIVNSILSRFEMMTFRLLLIVEDAGIPTKKMEATLVVVISAASQLHVAAAGHPGNIRISFTDTNLAVIVGIIGGCLVIVVVLVIAVCFMRKRKKSNKSKHSMGAGGGGGAGEADSGEGGRGGGGGMNVKYFPTSNGTRDDHSLTGSGSGPSYIRDSIGLPEELLANDDIGGYVIVNCTHPQHDSISSPIVYDTRRSRLYSTKSDNIGKCLQCEAALNQLQYGQSPPPPPPPAAPQGPPQLQPLSDYTRYASLHRSIYAPCNDYNQVMFSDAAVLPMISSPSSDHCNGPQLHQRKSSFSNWLNSESFHLRQKGQMYNVTDYGSVNRNSPRYANGGVIMTDVPVLDPPRSSGVICGQDRGAGGPAVKMSSVGPRSLNLMGKCGSGQNGLSSQVTMTQSLANDTSLSSYNGIKTPFTAKNSSNAAA